MKGFFSITSILALNCIVLGCQPEKKEEKPHYKIDEQAIKNQFEKANIAVVQKENDEMDYYGRSHQMDFVKTNSGVRYYVYKASAKGDSIREDSLITIDYTVSLLDGTECYSSAKEGPKTFVVGAENIENGIQKAVQYLKKGDKAMVLIPSHLAHGLLGDMKKIPPQMPIVYDIQIHQK